MITEDVRKKYLEALEKAETLDDMIAAVMILPLPPEDSSTEPDMMLLGSTWTTLDEKTEDG